MTALASSAPFDSLPLPAPADLTRTIIGGAGMDTVKLSGTRAQYSVVHETDGSFSVRSIADPTTVTLVQNVERLGFSDQTLALDVTPAAARVAAAYKMVLGRNPEDAGLVYYTSGAGKGLDSLQLATALTTSAEATGTSSGAAINTVSPTAFVTQLYTGALGRAPDAAGLAFYVDEISHSTSAPAARAAVVAQFLDSAEMAVKLLAVADQGIALLPNA